MAAKNTIPMRVAPEDRNYLKELAKVRYTNNKDKKEVSPARVLKAYLNLTKIDAALKNKILEAKFND